VGEDPDADARGHRVPGGLLSKENRGGEAVLSDIASKRPSEGSSIRPTGRLSNSHPIDMKASSVGNLDQILTGPRQWSHWKGRGGSIDDAALGLRESQRGPVCPPPRSRAKASAGISVTGG
jgi:hypothetical protein